MTNFLCSIRAILEATFLFLFFLFVAHKFTKMTDAVDFLTCTFSFVELPHLVKISYLKLNGRGFSVSKSDKFLCKFVYCTIRNNNHANTIIYNENT